MNEGMIRLKGRSKAGIQQRWYLSSRSNSRSHRSSLVLKVYSKDKGPATSKGQFYRLQGQLVKGQVDVH